MADNNGRRMFPEDIFAEENEKFSWQPLGRTSSCLTNEVINFNVNSEKGKDSSHSPSSEEDSFYKADSNSLKKSFRKRGSSSASDGNIAEDTSSSQKLSQFSIPHERVLPSIYDDDARSGSPSGIFEKQDLAFQSSFKKDFHNLQNKSFDGSSLYTELDSAHNIIPNQDPDDYLKNRANSNRSPPCEDPKGSREKSKSYSSRSRSDSKELQCLRPRSRSGSREERNGSQNVDRERHSDWNDKNKRSPSLRKRSRSPDTRRRSRSPDYRKRTRSPDHSKRTSPGTVRRTRSPVSRRRTRSPEQKKTHSPDYPRKGRSPSGHGTRRRSRSPVSQRSHSKDYKRRSRSRDARRRSHSRDIRRRSRSRSYDRRRRGRRSSSRDRYRRRRYSRSRSRSRGRGPSGRKPGSLPLSSSGGAMTPQMALQQTMAAMSAKAQAMTGIALPKYYNPAAVNPLKYAEQVQKRKLLWQNKEKEVEQPKNSVWDKLKFEQDQDGKMTAKFRKLMGIKSEGSEETPESEKELVLQKQAELFRDLDQQYEMARVTTHTQRGVGLGYSATTLYPPVQK